MGKQNIGINFELKFEEIKDINPSFALAKVAIAYHGRNRNMSAISKEVFEEALPSLFYCPVVGRYDPELDDFGAHDIRVSRDKDGNIEIQNATVPFGVVYGGTQPYWETVIEDDGTEKEYLYCEAILWKRQYGYDRLAQQDTWHQSMEIAVDRYIVDNDGYCVIEDMTFEALCILGSQVEPCFESASVQMKSGEAVSTYRAQFSAMINEMKESEEFKEMKIDFDSLKTGGGKDELILTEETINSILAEFNLEKDKLTFEIEEDMDEAAFRAALEAMKFDKSPADVYIATYNQKRDALVEALKPIYTRNGDGDIVAATYFYVSDFTDEHVFVSRYAWSDAGSHEDYGRFNYTITDNDDGIMATIESEFEPMILQWLTVEENKKLQQSRDAFEVLSAEFEEYKKEYTVKDSDVEELRAFKQERLEADHRAAVDELLETFEDLNSNADFIELIKDDKAYGFENLEDLEKECFAIRGRAVPVKFEKNNKKKAIKVPVIDHDTKKSRYGDLFERY